MVRAWYMEGDGTENPKDENQRLPPKFITLEELHRITGVEHYSLNLATYETDGSLEKIKEERGYSHEDEIDTPGEGDLVEFYKEHLHEDEEIRFVLEGCGYYDVRDNNDDWIRIEIVAGDLIIIPSGCYHRFTVDNSNLFKVKRLFPHEPEYRPIHRPADNLDCRNDYINKLQNGTFEASE